MQGILYKVYRSIFEETIAYIIIIVSIMTQHWAPTVTKDVFVCGKGK